MKKLTIIISFFCLFIFSGCLLFNKISYNINLKDDDSGSVSVVVYDIRTDAQTPEMLEEDKSILFDYLLKDDKFIAEMRKEDKNIYYRDLEIQDDILIGKAEYSFSNIQNVENIRHEDNFYYLTLEPADSVISTNGTLIESEGYKRILWEDDIKTLSFEMFSSSFDENSYRKMARFYKTEN